MKSAIVSENVFCYPDVTDYTSARDNIALHAPRGSWASVQILLAGVPESAEIAVRFTGAPADMGCELYELVPVYVEQNANITPENTVPHCPNRAAPFYVYDCMKPLGGRLSPMEGTAGLYLSFPVPGDDAPGERKGAVHIVCAGETFEIPVSVKVYAAAVPEEEHLKIINGYSSGKTAEYFGVQPGSEELARLDAEHLRMLRRMRQNMLYVGGVRAKNDGAGNYTFDFSGLDQSVTLYRSLGYRYFFMHGVGFRRSWKESTILVGPEGLPAMSYEAYRYLSQYLPALREFLNGRGWTADFVLGISDEPNDQNATEFRALCGLVRKFFPEIRLADALSYTNVHGALDVWIPLNAEYDKHRKEFESFRTGSDELWHYVCCGPRSEGYINRFMDYPLLSTRYLFWGNYKYDLTGYLHWASNCYQPGQDPFRQNCPEHHNADSVCILPPGDTHIIYPGEGHPWMSVRLEAQRRSAEDYELLRLLAQYDKPKADELCARCFTSFNQVEYGVAAFEAAYAELLAEVSKYA